METTLHAGYKIRFLSHTADVRVQIEADSQAALFRAGFTELPASLRNVGQPVLIPGSMGTASYILLGTQTGMEASFGTSCHGAGRSLSRRAAKKQVNAPQLKEELRKEGIYVEAGSFSGIAEEAPIAYKDVDLVVETMHRASIALKVDKLRPLAVVKG